MTLGKKTEKEQAISTNRRKRNVDYTPDRKMAEWSLKTLVMIIENSKGYKAKHKGTAKFSYINFLLSIFSEVSSLMSLTVLP